MTVDWAVLMQGLWLGIGFWAGTVAFFIFVMITAVITGLVLRLWDALAGKKGDENGRN